MSTQKSRTQIIPARQVPGEPLRRWFTGSDLELITWHDADDRLIGFQLCYDRQRSERALTWRADGGFLHDAVDSGESEPDANRTPILLSDGAFDAPRVSVIFQAASATLEPELRAEILARLATYTSRSL